MTISGIGSYNGLLNPYNNIAKVQPAEMSPAETDAAALQAVSAGKEQSSQALEDFRIGSMEPMEAYNAEKTKSDMDFLGSVGSFDMIDMDKEVNAMQKDSILSQYHYFVGNNNNVLMDNEDGTVIRK